MTFKRILPAIGFFLCGLTLQAQPGFTMRLDDNHTPGQWRRVAEIFEKGGVRCSLAVVPALLSDEQAACLKELVGRGHVVMDHMPNHSFYTITYHSADAFEKAKAKPFAVEADAGTKTVRFTCEIDRESPLNRRARASINGDLITFKGDAARVKLLYTFVGIAGKSGVFGLQQTPKGLQLLDFWRRPLKEKMQLNDVEVVLYDQSALQPCDDLLRELASVTRERFDHFGLPRPTIWVRPGGWCPGVAWERLERIYGREFGYSGADSRVGKDVVKGMNRWTTGYDEMYFFDQGADITPEQLIDRIAPRIAAGEYHVTLSHMWYRKLPGGFDEYCRKTEEFVRLLNARKIPTLTMVDVLNQRFGRP